MEDIKFMAKDNSLEQWFQIFKYIYFTNNNSI